MKRSKEAVQQSNNINQLDHFVLENDLVREINNKPFITSRGQQFLNEMRNSAGQLSLELAEVV